MQSKQIKQTVRDFRERSVRVPNLRHAQDILAASFVNSLFAFRSVEAITQLVERAAPAALRL